MSTDTKPTETLYNKDDELRRFIESWIPINSKDAQHVKEAKLEARNEFMRLVTSYGDQRELETHEKLIADIKLNDSDKYPTIDESNVLSYVDHGYAVACRTIRLNAERKIIALKDKQSKED